MLAYLTYDMTRHVFVKMSTAQMLENPYDHQNVYEVHQLYNLEIFEDPVNVAGNYASQQMQQHQGMILTDKDAHTLESNNRFKSVALDANFVQNEHKMELKDSTLTRQQTSGDMPQVSLYDAKKLNEQISKQARDHRLQIKIQENKKFKQEQLAVSEQSVGVVLKQEAHLRQEV